MKSKPEIKRLYKLLINCYQTIPITCSNRNSKISLVNGWRKSMLHYQRVLESATVTMNS